MNWGKEKNFMDETVSVEKNWVVSFSLESKYEPNGLWGKTGFETNKI